jgi:hypothetical protein
MCRVTDDLRVLHEFDRLIQIGRDILISAGWDGRQYAAFKPGGSQCSRLRHDTLTLLKSIWGERCECYRRLHALVHAADANTNGYHMAETVAILESAFTVYSREFLFDRSELATEVDLECIELAEALLNAGFHVPAAQRAGAILGRALGDLHAGLRPDATMTKPDADLRTTNDDLLHDNVYDAATHRRIAAMLQIRLDASGPRAERLHREDIADMIEWLRGFLRSIDH